MWTVNAGDALCTAERPVALMGRCRPMNSVLSATSFVIST